jgi:hypothetical protein
MAFDEDYKPVAERIQEFRDKYPDGRLRPWNPEEPFRVVELGEHTFLVYAALAFRSPDDPLPGFGCAWERFPGPTAYTRNSELQNAETSAWGRALVAALVADTQRGIATAEDVDRRAPATADSRGGRATSGGGSDFAEARSALVKRARSLKDEQPALYEELKGWLREVGLPEHVSRMNARHIDAVNRWIDRKEAALGRADTNENEAES